MSQPNSYAGYIEIAAAQHLYGLTINIVFAGSATFSTPPDSPLNNHMYTTLIPCIIPTPP